MKEFSDEDLLNEIQERFNLQKKLLNSEQMLREDLEKMNLKLRDSEAMKSKFLSNIRNELVNPLTSILGLSQNLSEGLTEDPEQIKKIAGIINSEMKNMNFQLSNIFYAADLEAGHVEPRLGKIYIPSIIDEIIYDRLPQIENKELEIEVENKLSKIESILLLDVLMTKIILENLLDNAIKFNTQNGRVKINLQVIEEEISIQIENTGVIISEDIKTTLFDPFVQGEEGSTKNFGGHGLGLSIVKSLIDLLNGSILIEGEDNSGTKVEVRLPIIDSLQDDIFKVQASNEEYFNDLEIF